MSIYTDTDRNMQAVTKISYNIQDMHMQHDVFKLIITHYYIINTTQEMQYQIYITSFMCYIQRMQCGVGLELILE